MLEWDDSQQEVLKLVRGGKSMLVTGPPVSGRSSLAVEVLAEALKHGRAGDQGQWWSGGLLLTPDRRRSQILDLELAPFLEGVPFDYRNSQGSHRLVRSLDSYAFLVVSLWLVERAHPRPRPTMFSGAKQDAWITQFLQENPELWKEHFSATVVESPVFRDQLRTLVARAGQAGLLAEDLRELGTTMGVPIWVLAADVYEAFAGHGERAFTIETKQLDSARIPWVAAKLLENWEQMASENGVHSPPPLPRVLVADDVQDFPQGARALLDAMVGAGTQVVLFAQPDLAAAAYRGGNPELAQRFAETHGFPTLVLQGRYQKQAALAGFTQSLQGWLPTRVPDQAESRVAASPSTHASVDAFLAPTDSRQYALVTNSLQSQRVKQGVEWEDMVVIARSAEQVEAMQRVLARSHIPLNKSERPVVFSKLPLTKALLELLVEDQQVDAESEGDAAADNAYLLEQQAKNLVLSPLVGADPLALHRSLRFGRAVVTDLTLPKLLDMFGGLGRETSQQQAAEELYRAVTQGGGQIGPQLKTAATLWALRSEAARLPAQQGLWKMWHNAGLSGDLQKKAASADGGAELAHEQLDAVLALFRKADLWEQEQMDGGADLSVGGATAEMFAASVLDEEVATDPLAAVGLRQEGVSVVTPAQAVGRRWKVGVILGLQEGQWPRVSGEGLGRVSWLNNILGQAEDCGWTGLTHIVPLPSDCQPLAKPPRHLLEREERIDEARLLVVAASRIDEQIYLVAVENERQVPGAFLRQMEKQQMVPMLHESVSGEQVPSYRTPDPLVAGATFVGSMRRTLGAENSSSQERADAASALALLAQAGVPGAGPETWGTTASISSDSAVLAAGDLRLSPSSLQMAVDCPLRWFLTTIQGSDQIVDPDPGELEKARLGTLLHAVAEENPHGTEEELVAAIEEKWREGGLPTDTVWAQEALDRFRSAAVRMSQRFAQPAAEVLVEQTIRYRVGGATVSGRADRIEVDEENRARVVDLKTGAKPPRVDQSDNMQLLAYQLGARHLSYASAGAELFYPTENGRTSWTQEALTEEDAKEAQERLAVLADSLSGNVFPATPATGPCRICQFRSICPAQPDSVRTVE